MSEKTKSPLPDDALVVRGGTNIPKTVARGFGNHPSGVIGVSVECAVDAELLELALELAHYRQIGVTTVGEVRAMGGDVIRTSGRSENHATLTGLTADVISSLLNPTLPNPAHGTG